MTKQEVRKLVDEAWALQQSMEPLQTRVNEISGLLKTYANGEKMTLVGTGCQAVIGTGAKLKGQIDDPKLLARVQKLAGDQFHALFNYAPVRKFKDVAAALFGSESVQAKKLAELLTGAPYATCKFEAVQA